MQLSDIQDQVRALLSVSNSDPFYADSKVTAFINSVNRRQSARKPWPWLETQATLNTVAGTKSYDLPANHRTTLEINGADRTLEVFSRRDHARLQTSSGTPVAYVVRNNDVHLLPTPVEAEALVHLYIATPATLVAGTDVPEIPDAFVDWLITETAIQFAIAVGDSERVDALGRIASWWWDSIQDEVRQTRGSTRIRRRRDW